MRRRSGRIPVIDWLLSGLAALSCASCGSDHRAERGRELPEPEAALRAVESALRSWQDDPQVERTTTTTRPVMFVEQQQPPGQRLLRFDILGETPGYEGEGYRRFLARLSLAEPDDSVVATYYVFGRDPVWVYRTEDFEMIMHMDASMMPAPPPVPEASPPEPNDNKEAESASRDLPPTPEGAPGTIGQEGSP
ncbi:hypothetical protein [Tautonia plasticadhaerens]|uniref:Lipoprotein n=1 Tax=Tautonia plasticadhaerens TaxID=2527974 RepID=A0A518H5W8_9BACT|nr:hypothetical protein [Tautonia plasticadhaerens]QDV36218.1 hypothetical protein ElP_41370 [Tautonia plasticadhaerens]